MARSKKDGKKRSGHKLRKWRRLEFRRLTCRSKAIRQELRDSDEELSSLDWDLYQEYLERLNDQHEDYTGWEQDVGFGHMYPDDDIDESYDYELMDRYEDPYDWGEKTFDLVENPDLEVFLAVDRAVRRHGLEVVQQQASMIAALFNLPSWEIVRCLNLTKHGYIRRSS